jgi:RimJ/RimL family protein N-acetyltransferase
MDTPNGRLQIREAAMSDLSAFKQLRLQALRDHPVAFTADYEAHAQADDDFWRNYLEFEGIGTMQLAVHGHDLAGMTGLGLGHSPKTRHSAVIWGVYVRPEWRGHHVAETLIDACLRWGQAHGVTIAKLGVAQVNEPAIRCYQRCGFVAYGVEPKAVLHEGVFYDELLMSRSLEGL